MYQMKYILSLGCILAATALLAGCAKPAGAIAQISSGSQSSSSVESGSTYHMKLHQVMDTEGTGKLAYTYLLPEGWSASDTIKWIPNNYMSPEVGFTTIKSPDGLTEFDSAMGVWSMYSHGPMGDTGSPPPKSVSDLLVNTFRETHPGTKFEVLSKEDVTVDSLLGTAPPQGSNFGVKGLLKVRFSENGKTFVQKAQARLDGMQMTPVASGMGGTMYEGGWKITESLSVTAPEDQLESAMKVFGIVLTSSRLDPHFFNTVVQTQKIISDNFYAQQRQTAEISQIISQTNDQISDSIMSSYSSGQATHDREASSFDDYIRGVDRYQDTDAPVELPSGYAHAWSDNNGNYIVTDQHDYDPNVGNTGPSWRELQRAG